MSETVIFAQNKIEYILDGNLNLVHYVKKYILLTHKNFLWIKGNYNTISFVGCVEKNNAVGNAFFIISMLIIFSL